MKKTIIILILLTTSLYLYMRYIEINSFTINDYKITLDAPSSFSELKIVHFSDVLINKEYSTNDLQELVDQINLLKPDIVFFTGDLLDNDYFINKEEQIIITDLLNDIEVSLYKFSIYGDNDLHFKDTYKEIMNSSDFILLEDETFTLFYKDNTPITITGINNIKNIDTAYTYDETLTPSANITLIHEPDKAQYLENTNLILAGHSLGGNINLPLFGGIITKNNAHIYKDSYTPNLNMYTSFGIGTEVPHLRFNNKPSINVYHIS